jgi:hyperosmotically inducible protein
MNRLLASSLFVAGALLMPLVAVAADSDNDRPHPLTYVKDSAITTKIKAKLAEEKISSLTQIKVETDGKGQVELSGTVASQAEADKAISIARTTEGVISVKSELKIKKD